MTIAPAKARSCIRKTLGPFKWECCTPYSLTSCVFVAQSSRLPLFSPSFLPVSAPCVPYPPLWLSPPCVLLTFPLYASLWPFVQFVAVFLVCLVPAFSLCSLCFWTWYLFERSCMLCPDMLYLTLVCLRYVLFNRNTSICVTHVTLNTQTPSYDWDINYEAVRFPPDL